MPSALLHKGEPLCAVELGCPDVGHAFQGRLQTCVHFEVGPGAGGLLNLAQVLTLTVILLPLCLLHTGVSLILLQDRLLGDGELLDVLVARFRQGSG